MATIDVHKIFQIKKVLRDGESNPGHLRDRQRCYQLHHRGSLILDVTLLTGFEPATSRLEV